ncbi:MAG: phage tail tape measure protein [Dorea sp.]|nr:phage tail tape measure protein [Dorea sp.]
MSEFIARIRGELDTTEAEKKLKDLTGKEHEVKLKTDFDEKSTQKGLDETVKRTQNRTKRNPIQVDVDYREGKSSLSQLADGANRLFSMFSGENAIDWGADKIKEALGTLKEMDSIITEISKTSDSTVTQLKELSNTSFNVASEYGRKATAYLTAVQEMSRSGFYGKQGEAMAELSMLGQAAGDMTSDVSNSYLLATSAAYDYAGSVEKLNTVLDGQNMITNRNSVCMLDMAQATSKAASMASQTGIEVDELSAIIGTAVARTKQNGNVIGTSLKSLFVNLQDTSNKKIVDTFDALGISQTKFINGSEQLKTPIELLKELSVAYNNLPEGSTLKADVLRNIGQKRQANVLSAILGGISSGDYDKMISDYSQGKGSAMVEAEKSAENLEGRLNSLSNSWTEFISKFAQTDTLKGTVSFLDGIVSSLTTLQDSQLFIPSMLSAIMGLQNVFAGKGITDVGISKDGTGSLGKLNVKGNLFGIDFTEMGNWKKHFSEAETELEKWNEQCLSGRTNVEKFDSSFKDNNAGFKAYISTVKDGSANIKDYRRSLEDAGEYQRTFSTSAKSILANIATGLLVGAGMQLTIAAFTKMADELLFKQQRAIEKAEVSQSDYSSAVSELESLNSELETSKSRIEELQALKTAGTISITEDAELTRLQNQNKELERQIALTEKVVEQKSDQAVKDAKAALELERTQDMTQNYEIQDKNGFATHQQNKQTDMITATKNELAELKKLKQERRDLLDDDIDDTKQTEQFDSLDAEIDKYTNAITPNIESLSALRKSFEDENGLMRDGLDKEAQDYYKTITDIIDEFNNIDLSLLDQQLQAINSFFDGSTTSNIIKEQLLEAAKSGESATDALHRMGVTLNDLGITGEGKKAVFDDYFRGLLDSAQEAEDAIKTIDGSVDGVKAAFESENQDANWKSMADLLKQAGELYKEGKVGTDDFQSAIQFIAPKEINPDDTKFDAQAYIKAYKKYKDKIKRYFDSDNPLDSAIHLQNDLIEKGLGKQTDNGIDWTKKFRSSADAAKAWGINVEAAEVAMHNLETYGAEFDDVMFSGEGLQRYETALNGIKAIRDSMSDGTEKKRLNGLISGWDEEYAKYENDLSTLTSEDPIVHIEFEYDLATVQQQIDEIKNGMVGSGGTTEEYMSLISSQKKKRDMLAEQKGMSKATSDDGYVSSLTAFDNLSQKLRSEYDTLGESGRRSIQQQQSALLELQSSYLNLFQRGDVADWDSFFNTKEADNIIKNLAKDTGKSVDDVKDELSKLTGVDTNNANKDVEINLKANDEATPQIDKVLSFATEIPQEIITELLAEDKASDHAINVLSAITGIPEETLVEINANDGASGVLSTVVSQITGIPESKVTELLATDNVSKLASLVIGSVNKIPNKHKTNITATDNASSKANAAKSAINTIPSSKHITIGGSISSTLTSAIAAAKAKIASIKGGGGGTQLNGTAHKEGTANGNNTSSHNGKKGFLSKIGNGFRRAFASGTIEDDSWINDKWKTKKDEVALTGEVGQEIIVHGNTWETVGDNGAEFAHIPAGSVVFNAKQTEELLKKGSIRSRGRALLNGTISKGKALLNGTAFANGMPNLIGSSSSTKKKKTKKSSAKSDTRYNKRASKKKSKKADKDAKKAKETFDWIEVKINRIERAIERLDTKASSVYRSWSSRNTNLTEELKKVNKEITVQNKGYDRYIKEARTVSKDAKKNAKKEGFTKTKWNSLTKKVRDGSIDISTIKNEKLAERIKEYQQWYEKALDCKDAIVELNEKVSELYETAFNNVVTQFEDILSIVDHKQKMLEESITQSEKKGYITSVKYYEALMKNERDNISKLQQEKVELLKSLNDAVNSGAIVKGSEAWYEMVNQIDDVTLSIEEANTAMIEYGNSIRNIGWEVFDLLQDKISSITDEGDFLEKLLSNDKLYEDKGQLTKEGLATMGLHGMNYNVHMAQADRYDNEIKELDKQIAEDPYDKELMERRQELLKLQQDMILAAEDEKQAIRDMVEEGIKLELESLKDLIDAYNEALDAQKDLYDYQKQVKEQTKEIANLEKQLTAYKGDDSEETKANIQQLKVSLEEAKTNLEETEYDKYISDQKKLLDDFYDEYEEILNKRLDNIELLISDMITKINENASSISDTLSSKAESVGYDLSESMNTIWTTNTDGITSVLTTYGEHITNGIESAATTVNAALSTIDVDIQNMINAINSMANTKIDSAVNSSASDDTNKNTGISPSTFNPTFSPIVNAPVNKFNDAIGTNKTSSTSSKKTGGNGKAEVGDKVTYNSGKYYATSAGTGSSGDKHKGKSVYITRIKKGAKRPYHISTGKKLGSGDLGWVNLSQLKGYAKGTDNVPYDQLAWTQEGGKPEAIIRKSDGAVLTPLGKGDMVVSQKQIETLRALLTASPTHIAGNLGAENLKSAMQNISKINNTNNSNVNNEIHLTMNLPNVTNYDEFIERAPHDLMHNKNFVGAIQAATVGEMSGGSMLRKYRV